MAKPISIDFAADTSKVIRETDNLADAFDEVSDSLKDVAKDTAKSGDKMEDSIKDAAKSVDKLEDALDDGGQAARDLDRKIDQAFDSISDGARDTGKKVGKGLDDGFREASDGAKEMSEEAASEAREMASSFDGSVESISDMFQSLAANAFQGFGPAGQLAGLAAAVGLGLAISKLQEAAEVNTEAKQSMADLAREIYDAGGALDDAAIAQKIADIAFSLATEDSWIKLGDQAQTYVGLVKDALGELEDQVTAQDSFKALAGDITAATRAQDALRKANEDATAALEEHVLLVDEYGNRHLDAEGQAIHDSIQAREELSKKIEEATGIQSDASAEVDYYTKVMGKSTDATDAQADAADAAREAVESLASAQSEAANAAMGADQAAVDWIDTLGQLTSDIAANGRETDINTAAGRANSSSLIDLAGNANAYVQALVSEGGATADVTAKAGELRNAFIAQAEAAGYTRGEAEALATSYGLIPENVSTQVQAHGTEEAKAAVEGAAADQDAAVTVTETGASGVAAAVEEAATDQEATVAVKETGAAQVQNAIDGIKGRDVPINLTIANAQAFAAEVNRLISPRTMYIDQVARPGVGVAP